MKFIKKHIGAIIAIIVFILVVVGLLVAKEFFFTNDTKAIYGNRLEEIDKYPITTDTKKQIKETFGESATNVTIRLAGRIVYIDVEASDETTQEGAKNAGNRVLECFSEEQKSYYDIQIMIKNEANTAQFPIIGYKHHTKTAISWTRDRAES